MGPNACSKTNVAMKKRHLCTCQRHPLAHWVRKTTWYNHRVASSAFKYNSNELSDFEVFHIPGQAEGDGVVYESRVRRRQMPRVASSTPVLAQNEERKDEEGVDEEDEHEDEDQDEDEAQDRQVHEGVHHRIHIRNQHVSVTSFPYIRHAPGTQNVNARRSASPSSTPSDSSTSSSFHKARPQPPQYQGNQRNYRSATIEEVDGEDGEDSDEDSLNNYLMDAGLNVPCNHRAPSSPGGSPPRGGGSSDDGNGSDGQDDNDESQEEDDDNDVQEAQAYAAEFLDAYQLEDLMKGVGKYEYITYRSDSNLCSIKLPVDDSLDLAILILLWKSQFRVTVRVFKSLRNILARFQLMPSFQSLVTRLQKLVGYQA